MTVMLEYWEALARLQNGCPVRVPKGSLINKDTIALEAGRKRGTIKKSRESFAELIAAIENIAVQEQQAVPPTKDLLKREREQKLNYRELYHQALNRELMLVERLAQLEKELARFKNVIPFGK